MKVWLIVGLLAAGLIAVLMAGEPNQTPQKADNHANPVSPPTPPTVVNNNYESPAESAKSDDNSPHWYTPLERSEWWLVVAAFLTLAVIWYQAREMASATNEMRESTRTVKEQLGVMERQTKAAEDAAETALLSAQAFINSERPWLLIPIENKIYDIQPPVIIERLPGTLSVLSSACAFGVKNYGRSPARIIESNLWMIRIGDASFPRLSVYEREGSVKIDYVVAPDATIPVSVRLEGGDGKLTIQEREAIDTGMNFLWLVGYLKYTDTFERREPPVYETRFCYRWMPSSYSVQEPFWLREGSSEYNRTT